MQAHSMLELRFHGIFVFISCGAVGLRSHLCYACQARPTGFIILVIMLYVHTEAAAREPLETLQEAPSFCYRCRGWLLARRDIACP